MTITKNGLTRTSRRGVKLEESFSVNNHTNLKTISLETRGLNGPQLNGTSGHSSSEEEPKRSLHNGDISSAAPQENGIKRSPSPSEGDKFLYTHKKFKKMATIAPFNYVSTPSPSPSPVTKPPPLQLKMPLSSQPSPSTPCSPSPEFLHRHITKLISENQAIVETNDPLWPSKKYLQRSKQDKDSPSSPSRNNKISPRTNNPSPSPHHFTFKVNSSPSSPLLLSSASYEAAYIKSLMSPAPSSPLSSASSSSSTEFSWPKKPPVNNHHQQPPSQSAQLTYLDRNLSDSWKGKNGALLSIDPLQFQRWKALSMEVKLKEPSEGDFGALNFGNTKNHLETAAQIFINSSSSRQTDSSKLASALLRPKFTQMSSSNCLPDDGDQPLNLTVKSSSSDEKQTIPHSRKRPLPEDDYSSNVLNLKREPKMKCLPSNHNVTGPPLFLNSDYDYRKSMPIKVSPPLPSPGPLLGSTPLVDPRSHIPTLRSLEELSRAPMRQQCHMFGGEVQIRDAIGDAKTMRIEPNKMKSSRENSTKVVTTAKSTGLGSGGTTILQVPQPSESAQVPRLAHQANVSSMLLLPPHSKLPTPTVPGVGSPSHLTSSYNGGVVTLLHGGRAIPHVPGIPGPLSLQIEPPASPVKSKLSAEVKPIIKNGRIPTLSEPTVCRETQDVKPTGSQLEEHSQSLPTSAIHPFIPHLILSSSSSFDPSSSTSESADDKPSRFLRPSSLPLKPGTYTPKRHLSSTAAQSLVSPETPRPRKGFGQLYLNGHAYTYLGLKCSTRLFFCTLNKPQPLYAPLSPEHQKVSMYSNWKICSEVDPNPLGLTPAQMMAHYSSSSRPSQYTMAHTKQDLLVTHSSYWVKRKQKLESSATSPDEEEEKLKLTPEQQEVKVKLHPEHQEIRVRKDLAPDIVKSEPKSPVNSSISPSIPVGALVPEVVMNEEEPVSVPLVNEEKPKRRKIFTGGFESTEDYIYIRGRGRGRFVCEECGIRCRKPSMLKKHIRTHSDVRLYTCNTCNFSFKTKGNLTKHMKSKAHYKKCAELGVSPMPSSEELSGDEKQDYRNSHSSESTEPGDSDEDCDEEDDEDDNEDEEDYDDEDDEEEYDEEMENEEEEEDGERINSELEHDVAHSLLSLAGMTPSSESAGLSVSTARPTTYPYSGSSTPTTNTTVTISTSTICSSTTSSSSSISCTTSTITVPSAFSVSALPTVRDSEKAAMSILPPQPPTSPNSQDKRPRAEFLPPSSGPTPTYVSVLKDGRSMCGICNKIFTKPSQLRLHVNIHYFERPFRCEACAVSFRTKGHLQKHQRSSSHLNKVNMNSTFGTPTTTNPRPFKCEDCKIAFRIHGHLAKHLRSKMHIMKLECGGKLPFGTYAELERCGYNLNDIDTTDCDNSLESLQLLAQKLYEKDPSKLGGWGPEMLPHSNGVGPPHTSGESSDEGEAIEPALGSPIHKTEPHLQMDKSPVDLKSC